MSDPLRTDPTPASGPNADAERDAKIESLLLGGLDHYFSSDYEQAIDVWTRALFFDLVGIGEVREEGGRRMFGVVSAGEFFAMAPEAAVAGYA